MRSPGLESSRHEIVNDVVGGKPLVITLLAGEEGVLSRADDQLVRLQARAPERSCPLPENRPRSSPRTETGSPSGAR